jgi:hypothetical protein
MLKAALEASLLKFNTGIPHTIDNNTLYRNGKPIASLNGLKEVRVREGWITLEFEDADPVHLMAGKQEK